MYKKIAQHPGTRKLYADKLEKEGVIQAGYGDELVTSVRAALDAGKGTNPRILYGLKPTLAIDWAPYIGVDCRQAEGALQAPYGNPRQLKAASIGRAAARRPPRDGRGQGGARLGHGGKPRLRVAGRCRPPGAPLRPGRRPRHLRAPPRGAARP